MLEEIIAQRELTWLRADGSNTKVSVLLGKPVRVADSSNCECPYQITGIGSHKVRRACGVDAFQAIELALLMIGADLEALRKSLDGTLHWEGDDTGGLGFPIPPP